MKNKKVCLVVIVIAIIAFLLSYIISYANTGETIYVNLTKLDTKGIGYAIGNPTTDAGHPATNAYIWNITTYDSANATSASREQRNLYCIKANYGESYLIPILFKNSFLSVCPSIYELSNIHNNSL